MCPTVPVIWDLWAVLNDNVVIIAPLDELELKLGLIGHNFATGVFGCSYLENIVCEGAFLTQDLVLILLDFQCFVLKSSTTTFTAELDVRQLFKCVPTSMIE